MKLLFFSLLFIFSSDIDDSLIDADNQINFLFIRKNAYIVNKYNFKVASDIFVDKIKHIESILVFFSSKYYQKKYKNNIEIKNFIKEIKFYLPHFLKFLELLKFLQFRLLCIYKYDQLNEKTPLMINFYTERYHDYIKKFCEELTKQIEYLKKLKKYFILIMHNLIKKNYANNEKKYIRNIHMIQLIVLNHIDIFSTEMLMKLKSLLP